MESRSPRSPNARGSEIIACSIRHKKHNLYTFILRGKSGNNGKITVFVLTCSKMYSGISKPNINTVLTNPTLSG